MSNNKVGAAFEKRFCKLLAENGFWVHRVSQNVAGQQPADVIAVKDRCAFLIDCKVCCRDLFTLSRMEPNQRSAMEQWMKCGNTIPFFALEGSDGKVFMLAYPSAVCAEEDEVSTLALQPDHYSHGRTPIDIWLKRYGRI